MLRTRRSRAFFLTVAVGLLATAGATQMQPLTSGSVMAAVDRLEPGQFIWAPQIAPQGPMLVVVNVATQRLIAYRNGVPVAVSTVSTGRPGHATPYGVFTILAKAEVHRSSKYHNAPMPFMERLTENGIALHAGDLPGYPASHGCIRLPPEFARLLFGETELGMTVVIVDQPPVLRVGPTPQMLVHGGGMPAGQAAVWHPELSRTGPVSIVVSAADRRMVVLRNGVEIGSAPVTFPGVIDKVQAYMLESVVGGDYRWKKVALPGQSAEAPPEMPGEDGSRFQGSDPFRQALASVVGPGTTMVVVPDSLGLGSSAPSQPVAVMESDPAAGVPGSAGETATR